MEKELANLRLLNEEEAAFQEDAAVVVRSYQLWLVGRCRMDSVVHFPSLRNTMVDLWHPIGGICITDLGDKRFLFQFFHEVDVQRVLSGLMSEIMAKQFGYFLGKLLEYDSSILTLGLMKFMRIRVRLDVSFSLKRKKKIQIGKEKTFYARFQYEKLSLFCFICGKLGHNESFIPFRLRIEPAKIIFGWDISLRAAVRRRTMVASRWLRQADGSQWSNESMEDNNQNSKWGNDLGCNSRGGSWNQFSNPKLILGKSSQQITFKEPDKWRNLGSGVLINDDSGNGPIDLLMEEENDPFFNLEGKKRQRIMDGLPTIERNMVDARSVELTASSGEQINRMQ
ncbi:hypothetical protein Gogos_009359 [Gossypium gossypioides]|uniref:DUF4283 domain-containing protein n=1 Tax=Gossypium gossypioides TaxID=34282 RepID=A0A7J9CEQ4_GOSGO|nr:hypothetical protein [Gossypium gossypioides]